jgi:hypothetical protein
MRSSKSGGLFLYQEAKLCHYCGLLIFEVREIGDIDMLVLSHEYGSHVLYDAAPLWASLRDRWGLGVFSVFKKFKPIHSPSPALDLN